MSHMYQDFADKKKKEQESNVDFGLAAVSHKDRCTLAMELLLPEATP